MEPGEYGEVVISNLVNRAMVLLNYRLGDLVVLSKRSCECGRTFPWLESFQGKAYEIIELPGGQVADPSLLWSIFKKRKEVQGYQVVQRGPWSFTAKVLPAEGTNMKTLEKAVRRELQSIFGDKAQVDILFVKGFPITAGRKFRSVVSMKNIKDRE